MLCFLFNNKCSLNLFFDNILTTKIKRKQKIFKTDKIWILFYINNHGIFHLHLLQGIYKIVCSNIDMILTSLRSSKASSYCISC